MIRQYFRFLLIPFLTTFLNSFTIQSIGVFKKQNQIALQLSEQVEESAEAEVPVRFLGKGEYTIVRPGCVLISPKHEHNTYLQQSAIFIYAIGNDKYGDHVTRGVVIDHPTVFTMGEMIEGTLVGPLTQNILFRGGDTGGDSAIMLHSVGSSVSSKSIGSSGVFEGGIKPAMCAIEEGLANPCEFKFFFNHVEFTDKELANLLGDELEGDAWLSVELPASYILSEDLFRAEVWKFVRKKLKERNLLAEDN